jgi:vacuole morphology and inheritance protein 14
MSAESGTFPVLLKTLSDPSETVVKRDLQLLAQISSVSDGTSTGKYFTKFISSLLSLFSTDRRLLEQRGSLIVRQLALHLDPESIFRAFSQELVSQTQMDSSSMDLDFARLMVQQLNLILMTAPELSEVRRQLKQSMEAGGSTSPLFNALYKAWCHDTVAVLSLCLLAQAYEQACSLLQTFTELEVTVSFLVQLDKLVQLLESPVFTCTYSI